MENLKEQIETILINTLPKGAYINVSKKQGLGMPYLAIIESYSNLINI